MIGKPITGRSFGGCIRYLVNRPEADILDADGVRIQSAASITQDFNQQRKLNPALGKAVGHTILSWSAREKGKLSDEVMTAIAKQYMEQMGITGTQYLIVRHQDREHPHLHIVYNRVNNEGKTISDQNNYRRNVKVCRALTETYGFYLAAGKDQVKRQRLKGADQVRYFIYDAVKEALKTVKSWPELERQLQQKGIVLHRKFKGNTDEVQGISFSKDGITFKASAIDRSVSFAQLERQLLQQNQSHILANRSSMSRQTDLQHDGSGVINQSASATGVSGNTGNDMLETLLGHTPESYQYDPAAEAYKRKKKQKSKRRSI